MTSPKVSTTPVRGANYVLLATAGRFAFSIAESGRRRSMSIPRFPVSTSLRAPIWVVESALCPWTAVVLKAGGGVMCHEKRVPTAANLVRKLRRGQAS